MKQIAGDDLKPQQMKPAPFESVNSPLPPFSFDTPVIFSNFCHYLLVSEKAETGGNDGW